MGHYRYELCRYDDLQIGGGVVVSHDDHVGVVDFALDSSKSSIEAGDVGRSAKELQSLVDRVTAYAEHETGAWSVLLAIVATAPDGIVEVVTNLSGCDGSQDTRLDNPLGGAKARVISST